MFDFKLPHRIVLVGAPGAGKGTQGTRLSEILRVPHVSTGSLFREEIKNSTPLGLRVQASIRAGQLVDDQTVVELTRQRLCHADCRQGFVLDGFPRTLHQARILDRLLEPNGTSLNCCLSITVDEQELLERLAQRNQIERRSDDAQDTVCQRLRSYETQTQPIVEYYRHRGQLVEVEGTGTVDEVTERIVGELHSHQSMANEIRS